MPLQSYAESMMGEIPPLPVALNYEMPLPGEVANPELVRDFLGITTRFGGDAQYGYEAYQRLGSPLLIAEATPIINAGASPGSFGLNRRQMGRIGRNLGFDPYDAGDLSNPNEPVQLLFYFSALRSVFSRDSSEVGQQYDDSLHLRPWGENEEEPIIKVARLVLSAIANEGPIQVDTLLDDVGLERQEAAETASDITESLFNYTGRLAIATAVMMTAQVRPELDFDSFAEGGSPIETTYASMLLSDIKRIMSGDRPRDEKLALVQAMYPVFVEAGRRVQQATTAENYKHPLYHDLLSASLKRVDLLPSTRAIIGGPVEKVPVREQVIVTDAGPAPADPAAAVETEPFPLEEILTQARIAQEALATVEARWLLTGTALKKLKGAKAMGHMLVTGECPIGDDVAGVPQRQAHEILAALNRLLTLAATLEDDAVRQSVARDLEEARRLRSEYEAFSAELVRNGHDALPRLEASSLASSIAFINTHRTSLKSAARFFQFGDSAILDRLLGQPILANQE